MYTSDPQYQIEKDQKGNEKKKSKVKNERGGKKKY
jgi:hypothetical protein